MPTAASLPIIRPISDLRTDLNSVCDQAAETQQPIYMTKNGKASLVVMDCRAYDQERQHERMVQKVREAEIEARYLKQSVSQKALDGRMSELFSIWGLSEVAHA